MRIALILIVLLALAEAVLIVVLTMDCADRSRRLGEAEGRGGDVARA